MTKYIKTLLIATTLLTSLVVTFPGTTYAASSRVTKECPETNGDRERDQQKDLNGDGLIGADRTSGFVDDDGCPMSQEQYEKYRKDHEGLQVKNIIIAGVILVIVVGGVTFFVIKRKKH